MNSRGVKEQNARLKLQLHYERNEGKRVIQTKIKSGNTNPTSDKDVKDPPTPLTPPTDNTPMTPPPEKDRKLSNVSKMNKSSVKDLTEIKGRLITCKGLVIKVRQSSIFCSEPKMRKNSTSSRKNDKRKSLTSLAEAVIAEKFSKSQRYFLFVFIKQSIFCIVHKIYQKPTREVT